MSLLVTLGLICFVVGIICVVAGLTAFPQALRPGIGLAVLGAVLWLIGYLVPSLATNNDVDYDGACSKELGTVTCSTVDDPHNNWETTLTQKGSLNSSHDPETAASNNGGNLPPGQQP